MGIGANCPFTFHTSENFDSFINEFYGDGEWCALGLIRTYDVTGDENYLDAVITIFNAIYQRVLQVIHLDTHEAISMIQIVQIRCFSRFTTNVTLALVHVISL